jgi:hypothetical protein
MMKEQFGNVEDKVGKILTGLAAYFKTCAYMYPSPDQAP